MNQSAGIVPLYNSLPVNTGWTNNMLDFPGGSVVKNPLTNAEDVCLFPRSGRSSGEGNSNSLPIFLPGKSHGQRSLVGYRTWDHKE